MFVVNEVCINFIVLYFVLACFCFVVVFVCLFVCLFFVFLTSRVFYCMHFSILISFFSIKQTQRIVNW